METEGRECWKLEGGGGNLETLALGKCPKKGRKYVMSHFVVKYSSLNLRKNKGTVAPDKNGWKGLYLRPAIILYCSLHIFFSGVRFDTNNIPNR